MTVPMSLARACQRAGAALLAAATLAAAFAAPPANAQPRQPMLVEGKQTVFQRVLAKTDAVLHDAPDGAALQPVAPFQPLYVYDRRDDWLEVGRGVASGPEGWTRAAATVEWKQNIVVSLANPAGRERQLMFESQEALMELIYHESPIGMAREMRRTVLEEGAGSVAGVASIEPEDYVDIHQNFYLLPILDWTEEEHPMTFEIMRVLKLASLPLKDDEPEAASPKPRTVGVTFVMDTTRSMEPYITATQAAIREMVRRIQESPAGPNTRFGAVGFRDSVEAAAERGREIGYRTRTYLEISADQTPEAVVAGFDAMEEATGSTMGFAEDALSGVWTALQMPGWRTGGHEGGPVELRYVIVVSDASPKSPGDPSLPEEVRDLDAGAIREIALSRDVILVAIHLKTADGAPNHRAAEAAYVDMTRNAVDGDPLYAAVDLTADRNPAEAFRPVIDLIADYIIEEQDRPTEALLDAARERELTPIEEASLAMRLEWLGRERDAGADELLEVWAVDRSLENPLVPALDRRLLITKNEIATMADVLREIAEIGDRTQGEMREGDFFELLRGALARMAQNPGTLVDTEFGTLDEAVSEYLADLPYSSPILSNITPERWLNMGAERRTTLDRVKSRLQVLEHFHDDARLWTALYEGAPPGEHVFAMPLEALP